MTPFSPDTPGHVLTDLCRLVAERVPAEKEIAGSFQARDQAAEQSHEKTLSQLTQQYQANRTAIENEYRSARQRLATKFDSEQSDAAKQYQAARQAVLRRFEDDKNAAERELQESHWEATAVAEAAKGGSHTQLKDIQAHLEARWNELQTIQQQAEALLDRWGHGRDFPEPPRTFSLLERHPMERFTHAVALAREQWHTLSSLVVPEFYQGIRPLGIFLLLWAVTVYPAILVMGMDWPPLVVSGTGSLLAVLLVGGWLYTVARRKTGQAYIALRRTLVEAGCDSPAVLETTKAECQRLFLAIEKRQQAEMKRANEKFAAATAELERRKQREIEEVESTFPPRLQQIATERQRANGEIEDGYPRRLQETDDRYALQSRQLQEEHARAMGESRERFQREWDEMAQRWRSGIEQCFGQIDEIRRTNDQLLPDWHTADWERWKPPAEIPHLIRVGRGEAGLGHIPGGIPDDQRLRPARTDLDWPVLLPFPRNSLLMFKANGEGRAKAVEAVQAIMLRMLTALPPGKVRFTIIDPVGLGENFSAFMHLTDYEELLVASRIWTDSSHIEQRLADLTQHMENVIQVYLRNEFQTIQEYNAFAGEMAEPYRVLVVANFPANFSETAALRLKSIVASGARCGVFVLMSVDTKLPPPRNFHLADLEANAMILGWSDGRFAWRHPDYGPVPLCLDSPPPAERFTEIVRAVGQQVKDAGRVEVPFHCITPAEDQWWTDDSRGGIDVPLGRAGAMKLQHLDLGHGTSQHVLVSGKTGSGKSTLLHVLITNLALRYSPDQVELYLVDFKKGVEFKAYARYGLPHARVIAIESEREFGLSVLQRLDAELRTRGDLFRRLGVQDLKGYRSHQADLVSGTLRVPPANGTRSVPDTATLPRILLVIDEFQELFVEDDRIAQEAALLLDRLVRQGRAFGIHILLGSQTLGGAYSLARSTIGQMAVRIALQCSESDAHLILSEENTAARLLTRPGEAIYNDANGLYEGNHPFQVVWLPDHERDEYMARLGQFAARQDRRWAAPIVFEGNVLADAGENRLLSELLAADAWPSSCPTPQAWLGSAVAIKDPTSATFVRQAGNNLLLVGHREEASLGVMTTSLVSLAAQHAPRDRQFYVLDGTRPDAPEAGYWKRLASFLPHAVRIIDARDVASAMSELAEEVARRQQQGSDPQPPCYLFIYNLGRFRELRKEDDFGFGSDDGKAASPAKQFASVLREGPALGIHTLAWCDSYSTVNRILDRQTLRDFDLRVLFQMSATDSSSLMDSPEAGRLGVHRAIFYDEAQGRIEKFRPYRPPSAQWLATIRDCLGKRLGSARL